MCGTSCSVKEEFLSRASEEMQNKQQVVCQIFEELEKARANAHTKISSILRQLPEKAYSRGVEEAKKEIRTLKEKIETKMESSEAMKVSNVRIQVSAPGLLDEKLLQFHIHSMGRGQPSSSLFFLLRTSQCRRSA